MSRLQELLKCRDSFPHFVTSYVKIFHPLRGIIPMEIYPFQQTLINNYEAYRFNLAVKFRDCGFSTMTQIWALWKAMFYDDQQIMTVARTLNEARHVGKLVHRVLRDLPDWMQPAMDSNTEEIKGFRLTGSRLIYGCCERVRSKRLTCLILDEAAFFKKLDEYWKEMYPSIGDNGRVIVVTTVNGIDPWFYDTYHKSLNGRNQFHTYHPSYKEHPNHTPEWEADMRLSLGEAGWSQEVEGNFLCR